MLHSQNFPEEEYTIASSRKAKNVFTIDRELKALAHLNQHYHILAIEHEGNQQLISLEDATYTIGRHKANAVVLDNPTVSRTHAFLLRICDVSTKQSAFRIIDGDLNGKRSHNGLWINGKRCFAHDLQDQDIISLGENVHVTYISTSNLTDPRILDESDILALPSPLPKTTLRTESTLFHKATLETVQDSQAHLVQKHPGDVAAIRLASFPELTPLPIIETNLDGQITYINPAAATHFPELKTVSHHPLTDGLYQTLLAEQSEHVIREITIGNAIYEQAIYCILQSGLIRSYLIDISQYRQTEQQLRLSEARYAAAAKGANDGLWDWDLKTHTIYFSDRWKNMLGYTNSDIGDSPDEWFNRIHPYDKDRVTADLSAHLRGEIPQFECEYRILHKSGDYLWFRCRGLALRNDQNQPFRVAGSQTDVTAYYSTRAQLEYKALHDEMTQLPNRVLFMERLAHTFKMANHQQMFAVLFLDLDRFKLINDSLGHAVGDQLLIAVAQRLKGCLHEQDTTARFGGDEFAILLNTIEDLDDAIQVAQNILSTLKTTLFIEDHEIYTSASIGIAISGPDYHSPDELLQGADTAMYRAKKQGKNCYEVFSTGMRAQVHTQLQLETDLQRAISNNELYLVYQPIVDLATEKTTGFEALLRWHHPERGLIPPSEFIPVAEDAGLMVAIDWWVLTEACRQMAQWLTTYPHASRLTINVNISAHQFLQPTFCEKVMAIIHETGMQAHHLKLEITEGVILSNAPNIAEQLNNLKKLGIQLAIDDFGTGYSSLSYLYAFPLDVLKVDYSFVARMDQEDGLAIVRTIVNLGQNLNMKVVAEGVETKVQQEYLREMGCEYAQGYLFSRPLKTDSVETILTKQHPPHPSVITASTAAASL
ncbi:EAL domain-containing protein [Acaryochloris sp. IP29b_bin.148]|uniref:EAL domain-containing protein n=1 Tax=Acaryochloris sp. IP29b_bin.148 TaxID=2969218 RepID=UPI002630E740|nr:EAL domain-containing protein [Acaryochloris sp. IP29b_bin.148]